LAKPKSRILTRPSGVTQDIVGLQIPVDNAGGVRGRQAIRNLHREIQQLAR